MNNFALKDSGARQEFDTGARRDIQKGKGRPDLISTIFKLRLAVVMEKGADKYGDRNWERGMPLSRYVASAMRHLDQYVEGWRDEDHLGQAAFNIMALIHTEQLIQDGDLPAHLADLPRRGITYDGVVNNPNGVSLDEYQQNRALHDAGLAERTEGVWSGHPGFDRGDMVEGLDGVRRGKTTIDESVRNPGERQTPIYAQPAVFEPSPQCKVTVCEALCPPKTDYCTLHAPKDLAKGE